MKKITTLIWPIVILTLLLVAFNLIVQTGEATNATIVGNSESSTEQVGPPWYHEFELWNYRRPLVISSDALLYDYQVLIKLDKNIINFDQDTDGADVRFTDGNSTYTLTYWIESWDSASQLAYIWVKVPTLEIGETTIYLYYDNPGVSTTSDGLATFDFFDDDWNQFTGVGCGIGTKWDCLDGTPTRSSGDLVLISNTGIATHSLYQFQAVGYRAKFGLGAGYEWGGFINGAGGPRTMIRDLPIPLYDVHDLYLQDYVDSYENNLLEQVVGNDWHDKYHVYEIRWREGQSVGDIDHGASIITSTLSNQVPSIELPVTFYSYSGSNAALWVDWVYIRQYRNPEPTVKIGSEQGLVDLRIKTDGSPDPVYVGEELTYQLTITNTSSITATGVILTDTLPEEITFANAIPSQGSCNSEVVCNLGTIPKHSAVSITVEVTPTVDEVFTNTAVVNSQGYDLNIDDNTYQEMTTVLPSADLSVPKMENLDPVRSEVMNAYTITVLNNGPSQAVNVVLTDTLPSEFLFESAVSELGSCIQTKPVRCDISHIDVNGNVEVTVQVTPTIGGVFTNTVNVASETYDPNLTNNTSQEGRMVDAEKPTVEWVSPVTSENTYFTPLKSMITLIARAEDNDQVDRVEYQLWDHINQYYVDIGTATTEPYQVEFDSDMLIPGQIYQMFVAAFDRAGNESDRQRIFIERPYFLFVPLINKK